MPEHTAADLAGEWPLKRAKVVYCMPTIGDNEDGFSVELDAGAGEVRVKAWGFWSAETAAAFEPTVCRACGSQRGVSVVFDMTVLKPMRDEGQGAFGRVMGRLVLLGVSRASVLTVSQVTKLQLLRLVREHAAPGLVQFV
jgi:hypothetical protein